MSAITLTGNTIDDVKISLTYWAGNSDSKIVAFLFHGFSSSQKNSTNKALVPFLLSCGIAPVTFDFRGCGASEGDVAKTTITSGLLDFEAVRVAVDGVAPIRQARSTIFIGSSFGGTVAIAATRKFHANALFLKSPMIDIARAQLRLRGEREMKEWEERGFLRMHRKSGVIDLSFDYVRDSKRYNFFDSAYCLGSSRTFIVHGDNDEIAPVEFSQEFVAICGDRRKLQIIEGANHEYSDEKHFGRMIESLEMSIKGALG